jgi:hypothetical protein
VIGVRGVPILAVASLVGLSCGGPDVGPSPPPSTVRVISITPNNGTTLGGTPITISGANFAPGASVTVGGAPATTVAFVNDATLTAVTPQHAAASVDVVVTVGTNSGSLARGFTFVANSPPTISSMAVRHPRPRAPAQYASLGETVSVTAFVADAETPLDQMTFAWSSDVGGTFTGTGAAVTWSAPTGATDTPRTATLTVVVTERYSATDASGLPISGENRATGSTAVRLHNSPKEVGDLASEFLLDFSKQLDPAVVMRNFTPTCPGTADELGDVRNNQANFLITSYTVGTPATRADFTGTCPFRNRFGDACAIVPVEWHSTIKSNGRAIWTRGFDQVTAILENDQWKLCASDYDETAASPLMPAWLKFKR